MSQDEIYGAVFIAGMSFGAFLLSLIQAKKNLKK
tara:strand:+ start:670 stop:771 length:102 start_codon:yes stop_codon:yes gene_type:complete